MYPDIFPMLLVLIVVLVLLFFPLFVLSRLWNLTQEVTELRTWQEVQKPDIAALHGEIAELKQRLVHIGSGEASHETAGTAGREAATAVAARPEHAVASTIQNDSLPRVPQVPNPLIPRVNIPVPQTPASTLGERPSVSSVLPERKPHQPTVPPLPAVHQPVPAAKQKDIESLLGANWLAKLGIAAIAVAVAFFLQYAFRSGMIGPKAQVAIGLCGSALMLGGGQYLLRKEPYRAYAQVLASGGIIVFFLSIYAAYAFYQPRLLGYAPAFAAFAVGALATSILALKNGTEGVAVLCVLGAFAAPVLIREFGTGATQPESLLRLYAYLAVLNLWVVGLLRFRAWHSLAVVAFASTWLLFYNAGSLKNSGWATEGFAALFLLSSCYMGVRGMYVKRTTPTGEEQQGLPDSAIVGLGLIVGGCAAFAFASTLILNRLGALGLPDVSLAGIVVALILAGMAAALPTLTHYDKEIRLFLGYLSTAALVLVLGIAMSTSPAPTREHLPIAFCFTLFNFLLFLATSLVLHRRPEQENAAAVLCAGNAWVHIIMVSHVLQTLTLWEIPALSLWLPLAGVLLMGGIWIAARQQKEAFLLRATLLIAAQILPLYGFLALKEQLSSGVGAFLFAGEFVLVSATGVALRHKIAMPQFHANLLVAFGNAAVFFCLIARVTGKETYQDSGFVMLAGWAIAMAVYHACIGGIVLRKPTDDALHRLIYLGLALTFVSIAIPLQLKASYITLAWAIEATILVWTGKATGERRASVYGVVLLALAAIKALCIDLLAAPLNFHFLLNTRMLAGAAVIVGAYVSAWLLWQDREQGEDKSEPQQTKLLRNDTITALLLTSSVLTLLFVSFDLWDYVVRHWTRAEQPSIQQFALSAFWAVYAVCGVAFGLRIRHRPVRLLSLGVLGLAALKAVTADISTRPAYLLPFLNTRMLAGAAIIIAAYLIAWLFWRNRVNVSAEEQPVPAGLGILANALTLLFVSVDLWDYTGRLLPSAGQVSAQHLALSIFWTVYALVGVSVGIWKRLRAVRLFAMGLLYLSIVKVFLFDLSRLEPLYRIFSFFTLGVILLLVSYLYTRFEGRLGSGVETDTSHDKEVTA